MVTFGEVRRVQLAKSTLLTSTSVPLGSFKVRSDAKEYWGAYSNGSYSNYLIPGKTAALVPEFAVEDLRSAELQPIVNSLKD